MPQLHDDRITVTGTDHLRLLTLKEVAELTQFSMPTVYRLIARGELPVVTNGRAGRAQRVRVVDLELFLANGGRTSSRTLKFPDNQKMKRTA